MYQIVDGSSQYMRAPMVGWEQVCSPMKEGDLGIKYSVIWNTAFVGKLVWWIYSKPDSLWVKWIHQIYLKGSSWQSYIPKPYMGGNWKDICKTKEILHAGYNQGHWLACSEGYTVASAYEWLRTKMQKVGWAKLIWRPWNVTKHSFLCWLVFRGALPVKERLHRHGITDDDCCCICQAHTETTLHLFQTCSFALILKTLIATSLHIPVPVGDALIWVGRRHWSKGKTEVCLLAFMAMHYNVWHQRNISRLEGRVARPEVVMASIIQMVKIKCGHRTDAFTRADKEWFQQTVLAL